MLVDSHAHIGAPRFDRDRDKVMDRAREAGVSFVVDVGSDLKSSKMAIGITQQYGEVYAAVGFHPHNASRMINGDLERLSELTQ